MFLARNDTTKSGFALSVAMATALFTASTAITGAVLTAHQAYAQAFDFSTDDNNVTPVEVLADNGIEWMRDGQRFIARGNASAQRGDTTVYADTLTAHYRKDQATGKSKLWRLDADGDTRIVTPTETATGDTAVYDLDKAILILKGKPHAKLVTPDTTITAVNSLEYWETKRLAIARGNAVIVREDRTLYADLVTAHFTEKRKTGTKPNKKTAKNSKSGQSEIDIVDAFGHVKIKTPTETVTGDKGRYNVKTGIATILHNVHLTRGTDTLNGAYAVVNMNTGVSTLYAQAPGAPKGSASPVRGSFIPKQEKKPAKKQAQ